MANLDHKNPNFFGIFGAQIGHLKGGNPVRICPKMKNKGPPLWFSFLHKNDNQMGGLCVHFRGRI